MCWLFEKTYFSLLRSIWAKKSCALIPLRRDGHGVEFIILRQNNVSSISVAKHRKKGLRHSLSEKLLTQPLLFARHRVRKPVQAASVLPVSPADAVPRTRSLTASRGDPVTDAKKSRQNQLYLLFFIYH